jgi:hypothetical protein
MLANSTWILRLLSRDDDRSPRLRKAINRRHMDTKGSRDIGGRFAFYTPSLGFRARCTPFRHLENRVSAPIAERASIAVASRTGQFAHFRVVTPI